MGVNSLPKTVTRQRRDCDLNPGPTAPESSTLTIRLARNPQQGVIDRLVGSVDVRRGSSRQHLAGHARGVTATAIELGRSYNRLIGQVAC